jgi:hypothetical protein
MNDCSYKIRLKTESESQDLFLAHYGVKGQQWGVVTKEYEPVAIDHRKTGGTAKSNLLNRAQQGISNRINSYRYKEQVRSAEAIAQYRKEKAANDKKWKRAKIGAAVLATALVAYGAYKVNKIVKAKAYTGLLNNFLKKNPNANFGSSRGRASLINGIDKATANSKTFKDAWKTNKYLRRNGMSVGRRDALSVYKTRRLIAKASHLKV